MRFPVSRRSLLLFGASGASLSLLSGCGLRLDTGPDVPTLDDTDRLRNKVARILDATTPDGSDTDTAREDLQKLRKAIGPIWSPPSQMATDPPPTEKSRTYIQAAEAVTEEVFSALPSLSPPLIPVLVDAATGLAVTAGAEDSGILRSCESLIRDSRASVGGSPADRASEQSTETAPSAETPQPAGAPGPQVWNAILDRARAASYGYERLTVMFDAKSPQRRRGVARLESLGSLAGEMLEKLGETDADPGAPAWNLDPSPTDPATAEELALNLEDGLAAALLPWLRSDGSAALRLWESARARTVFTIPQVLRYSYPGESGEAEAKK
ncbi:hypothetical protein [Brevibacterium marinum]|uniref:DUF4439 domain-containing protein n=1 Tax=Brevibacterium marinum TaxID=418643 RepID=A0A846S622_9MICO|nr:hypothetical protein [Brevibacterium marinum]NJC56912.1 hypothetical protein [Brevibacterium marinum]